MNPRDSASEERLQRLMMAALDGEISAEERRELDELLDGSAEARREWDRLNRVKEVTRTMAFTKPPDEVWHRYWTSVYNRAERGIGWVLVSLGSIVLLGYAAWGFIEALLRDSDAPLLLRLGIFAAVLGLVVLLVSVIREKLFTRRHERYGEVER